jgi:hypothetical protein
MEKGLLDYIFQNLDVRTLNRNEVHDHLNYLNEIITPDMSVPDQVKFLALKVRLNDRLIQLDRINFYSIHPFVPIDTAARGESLQANNYPPPPRERP